VEVRIKTRLTSLGRGGVATALSPGRSAGLGGRLPLAEVRVELQVQCVLDGVLWDKHTGHEFPQNRPPMSQLSPTMQQELWTGSVGQEDVGWYLQEVLDERRPAGQLVRLLADALLTVRLLGLLGDAL